MPSIALSPHHHLFLESAEGADGAKGQALEALRDAFVRGSGYGLLFLDESTDAFSEDPAFAYWKDFARLYLSLFASVPDLEVRDLKNQPVEIDLGADDLSRLLLTVPPMKGAEYVSAESLRSLWSELAGALHARILQSGMKIDEYFSSRHARLSLLGRVCFHLAENKNSPERPFAFLATYAHRVSKEGKAQHLPLNRALEEYASAETKNVFLRLLAPIQKAAKESLLLKEMVQSGEIYQMLAWTPREAHRFLTESPVFERAGIAIRIPDWWKQKQKSRPQLTVRVGEKAPSAMGLDALVDFSLSVVLGEQELSQKELKDLLSASENLVFFRGQWVEVDRDKLGDLLAKWKAAAKTIGDGLSFGEAMRMLAGLESPVSDDGVASPRSLTRMISGEWLTQVLNEITSPEANRKMEQALERHLKAELRPYQRQGVAWLNRLNQLRLGGILADDMGLGKTIQIISLLLIKKHATNSDFKALLVVPASLIGNWKAEIKRFAPSLRLWIAHPSGDGYAHAQPEPGLGLESFDVVLTTYGSLGRGAQWISKTKWDLIIADEAQAIKNPGTKQAKALKALEGAHRLALTGTPVENHLSDLWSLFDFVSPGLLGSPKQFESFMKSKAKNEESNPYGALRTLVRPYILRRLKTDKSVIQDLPEKTEMRTYCQLSMGQAALYQKSVESLAREIESVDGIKRRGVILSYLMRFKQICNHPSQLVKDERFAEADSGKFQRLREICEIIAEKQEKVLVFTQFREMTEPLHDFLASIFGRSGLVLHGETNVKKRAEMVERFQREGDTPFFVLSLKAGGTGLNLTAASHVIHFDRWWNPAVENQATDRAFRIGQKKNVLVHKFICKGTLEEKIDAMIEGKKSLSKELLDEGAAAVLTELGNDELLKVVALDMTSAVGGI